jgi:hypothetical protein
VLILKICDEMERARVALAEEERERTRRNNHGLGMYNSVNPISMEIIFFKSYLNEAKQSWYLKDMAGSQCSI